MTADVSPRTTSARLVIFDNDGVLVDSEPLANGVLADLLCEAGYDVTVEQCMDRFMGGTLARVRTVVDEETGTRLRVDFDDEYHLRLLARLDLELVAVPGVEAAIATLGQPSCVASSGEHRRIEATLRRVGLWDHFRGRVFSAQDVAHGKPAPDLFLHAAASCKVQPEACIVVEDSAAGVAAARAAGMRVLGFAQRTPAERLHDADAIFTDMAELPGLVAQHLR